MAEENYKLDRNIDGYWIFLDEPEDSILFLASFRTKPQAIEARLLYIDEYNEGIDEYEKLLKAHNELIDDYNEMLDDFNEYLDLTEKKYEG